MIEEWSIQGRGTWNANPPKESDKPLRDKEPNAGSSEIISDTWYPVDLFDRDTTVNLDDQHPSVLFYLGLVSEVPIVSKVYVEHLASGRIKIWTIVDERDYTILDKIYKIEEETLDRFPNANLSFRVTVKVEGTPTISANAEKIFEA